MPTNLPARKPLAYDADSAPATPSTLLLQVAVLTLAVAWLLVGIQTGVLPAPNEFPEVLIGP
jgi:hypothetical protein